MTVFADFAKRRGCSLYIEVCAMTEQLNGSKTSEVECYDEARHETVLLVITKTSSFN